MKPYLTRQPLPIVFCIALTCLACSKYDSGIMKNWEHISNDPYLEFYDEENAFIETNDSGIVGGL